MNWQVLPGLTVFLLVMSIPFLFRYLPYREDFRRDWPKIRKYGAIGLAILAAELALNAIWGLGINLYGAIITMLPFLFLHLGLKKMRPTQHQDPSGGVVFLVLFLVFVGPLFGFLGRTSQVPHYVNAASRYAYPLLWVTTLGGGFWLSRRKRPEGKRCP